MSVQQALKDEFQALMDEEGSTIVIIHYTATYNIASGEEEETETGRSTYKASIEAYESSMIGGLIQAGDIQIVIIEDPLVIISKATDKVLFANEEYSIEHIAPEVYRDLVISQTLQVRK